jgi:hypothetical protein
MREAAMKLWKFAVAAILLAPLAGCVSKADLRNANQALELENYHLERRLNEICWKLEDAQRDLDACRTTGAIPVYNGGGLTPVAPARRSSTPNSDPRRPPEAGDIDKPPKIELPDDEPNMPSAGTRKERAPRYNGPPVISPPDPNVPEGILPHSVSSRSADGEPIGSPDGPTYRYEGPAQGPYPQNNPPPDDAPRSEPEPVPATQPAQPPNWRPPNVSAPPPLESVPQPEPESVSAPMPAQMPAHAPSQAPAPVADRGPEAVAAPEPVREPAPAPVGRAMPSAQPENVAAPPGSIDTELRAQPDSRPLVDAEPVVAPHPSTTARPTSAPIRPSRQRGNTQAGNAALSMMAMNPKLTVWRHSQNGNSPDDGLTVVVEPRSAAGEMVEVDGDIAIMAIDPTLEGAQSKLARWDFKADKVSEHFQGTKDGGGFHFRLEWPAARPTVNRIDVYVRLTVPDGRQFVAEYSLDPSGASLPLENAPTAAPEPAGAPSEPPTGPPVSKPVDGAISRTAAWTSVPEHAPPRQASKGQPAKQAVAPKAEAGEWKRAVTPLSAAPQSFDYSSRSATGARGLPSGSPQAPSSSGSSWSPYR